MKLIKLIQSVEWPFADSTAIDKRAFNNIFIAILLALLFQTYQTYFPIAINFSLSLIIVILAARGCFIYLTIHQTHRYVKLFAALIIYFLIVGLSYGGPFDHTILGWVLSQDLRYVLLTLAGGIFACGNNMKYFHQIMKLLAVLSLLAGVLSLLYFDLSMAVISSRSGSWSISYYYWWVSGACYCYMGYYAMFMKKDQILGYGAWFFYVFLGILFLKRIVVVNSLVMIVFFMCFTKNKVRNFAILFLSLIAIFVVLELFFGNYINDIYNLMMARFDVDEDTDSYSLETKRFFDNVSLSNLLIGNGIGHYIDGYYIRGKEGIINALHVPWVNLLYKGGVVYTLYYICLIFPVARKLIRLPENNFDRVCLGVAIFAFLGPGWSYTIDGFCMSVPLFYTAMRKRNEKPVEIE